MPTVNIKLPLTDPQAQFLKSTKPNVVFVGGRGAGKSFSSFLRILTLPPNSTIFYIAPTYPVIRDVCKATLKKIAERLYHHTKINIIRAERISDNEMEINNGTKICFRGAENYEKLRGISTGYLFIDEAAQITKEAWDIISATLREGNCRLFLTTTPKGKLNWVYDFIKANPKTTEVIKAPTITNRFINADYQERLKKQYTSDFARQELEAEFIDGVSIMRSDWIKKGPVEDGYTILAIDPAISTSDDADYTAYVVATYKDGQYYIKHTHKAHLTFRNIIERAQSLYNAYKCQMVVVEDVAFQKALVQELEVIELPVLGIKPHNDKVARFMNTAAKFEQGRIVINETISDEYIDELLAFPDGEHDDYVDATAYAINQLEQSCAYSEIISVGRW